MGTIKILDYIANHKYTFTEIDKQYIECLLSSSFIQGDPSHYKLTRKGTQFRRNGSITKKTKQLIDCILNKLKRTILSL